MDGPGRDAGHRHRRRGRQRRPKPTSGSTWIPAAAGIQNRRAKPQDPSAVWPCWWAYGARRPQAPSGVRARPRRPSCIVAGARRCSRQTRSLTDAPDVPPDRRARTAAPRSRRRDRCVPRAAAAEPWPAPHQPTITGASVLVKPPVRKLAKDLGIDVADVPAVGPVGVILALTSSLRRARGAQDGPKSRPSAGRGAPTLRAEQLRRDRASRSGVRKAMAMAMTRSTLRAARQRVVDPRRSAGRRAPRPAAITTGLRRDPPDSDRRSSPRRSAWHFATPPRSTRVVGRGGPGDRDQTHDQPRVRRRHAAWPDRPERQGRRPAVLVTWPVNRPS